MPAVFPNLAELPMLSDEEIVDRMYDRLRQVNERLSDDPESDRLSDQLCFALDELLERFAPYQAMRQWMKPDDDAPHPLDVAEKMSQRAAVRYEARCYAELCDEARGLGVPVSLDDPRSPRTVEGLREAVREAKRHVG